MVDKTKKGPVKARKARDADEPVEDKIETGGMSHQTHVERIRSSRFVQGTVEPSEKK